MVEVWEETLKQEDGWLEATTLVMGFPIQNIGN